MWAVAVCIAIIGAALLSLGGPADEASKTDLRGDALSVAAAILVTGYMVCAKLARRDLKALDVIFWATFTEMFVAGAMVGATKLIPAMPTETLLPETWSA